MLKFLVRFTYLPLFLIVGNGISIYIVSQGLNEIWLLGLLIAFILLSFALERLAPFDVRFNQSQGDGPRDFIHALVNESSSVIGVLSVPFIATFIPFTAVWPTSLPLWLQVVIAVLIADIGITLAHYASHRFDALWKLHAVHHSIKRMYGFNGLMKHPLHQTIETVAGTMPLILLGIPQEVLMLLVVAVLLQLLLQHSNVAYFTGPLKRFYVSNAVHRFHHLNTAKEGDVNFGLFTTFTDHLLGTVYFDKDRIITTEDIGISTRPDYPVDYVSQLIEPFRTYQTIDKPISELDDNGA